MAVLAPYGRERLNGSPSRLACDYVAQARRRGSFANPSAPLRGSGSTTFEVVALQDGALRSEIEALGVSVTVLGMSGYSSVPVSLFKLVRRIRAFSPYRAVVALSCRSAGDGSACHCGERMPRLERAEQFACCGASHRLVNPDKNPFVFVPSCRRSGGPMRSRPS